jgi:carboxymethylenebutenolidase
MHAFYKSRNEGIDGFLSRPTASGPWPAILVIHEWWGLEDHFREMTRMFARKGCVALAPDLYRGKVTADREEAARLKTSLDIDRATREILGGVPYLRGLPFVGPDKIGIIGFCMGGGLALLSICRTREITAAVIYFQSMYPDPGELVNIACPILCHCGEDDIYTPRSEVEAFERVLKEHNKSYQVHFYKNAGHAFCNEMHPELYRKEAAEASWPRTFEFFQKHLKDA